MSTTSFDPVLGRKVQPEQATKISFDEAPPGKFRLYASQVLAILGCVLLVGQAYTWIGFFSHPITSATPSGPFNAAAYWYARINEAEAVTISIIMLTVVIRQSRRAGRLTFDAKFCIAGALTYWCDPWVEYFQPIFFNSSYYVNVHDWTGYYPFIVDPDAGTTIEIPLFLLPMYTFCFLLYAMILNFFQRKVAKFFPGVSMVYLWLTAFVIGAGIEIACEVGWLKYGLEAYPGAPDFLAIHVGQMKMPFIEWFTGGFVFATFSCVRYYVNNKGERITERGLSQYGPKLRAVISTIAMVAILNSLAIGVSMADAISGLYSTPWPTIPSQLLLGACDQGPGPSVTRYGPCPGTPGYRMPIPGSLPGKNPHGRS